MNGVRLYMHRFNSRFRFWMFLTMFKHSVGGDIFFGEFVLTLGIVPNKHFFENYGQFAPSMMQINKMTERVLAVSLAIQCDKTSLFKQNQK